MFDYDLTFQSPWWLLLLLVIPLMWAFSLRSLSGLGRKRRWAALLFRTVVLTAVILALAEVQLKRTSDRLTVLYVLDVSESIPREQRQAMVKYVNEDIKRHRNKEREDRSGVVVFGRDAAIEHPPYDDNIRIATQLESRIETDFTNLSGALKLRKRLCREDSAGRVVIISDGNENLGNAHEQAQRLAEAGVGIDALPVRVFPARRSRGRATGDSARCEPRAAVRSARRA